MIVSGKISTKAILQNRKRPIQAVYILETLTDRDRECRYVLGIAKGLKIVRASREALDELAGNTSHGGYLVECGARESDSVEKLLKGQQSFMLIEGVSDPFNMGEICRTIKSLGFDGIITPSYDYYDAEAKLIRASAGASESLIWHQSEDLQESIKVMKAQDVTMMAAFRGDDSVSLIDYKMPNRVCICLGGALRGLSRHTLELMDDHVRIDYDARVSLSTVGATSVFAYEHFRQKG